MRKKAASPERQPLLHPYARISDPEQRKGGGLERQTAADVSAFAGHFGFTVSKRVRVDDGVSAWKGLNASPGHQLGQFLVEARRGLIAPGDCLLLENYDRLSRQDPWAAIGLVSELRQLGIHVGRLDRMKLLRCDSTDPGDFFEAAVEFVRGNSESNTKSFRNKARWKERREAARQGKPQPPRKDGRVNNAITDRLPAWVEIRDGKKVLKPGPVAAIKRIFELAAAGYGVGGAGNGNGQLSIVKKLIAEGVPPFGGGERWARSYVGQLLKDRRVLGEFQPCAYGEPELGKKRGKRLPAGPVIPDYFPAAVTQREWDAARAGCAQRKVSRGRLGRHVNVFSGLLVSARDGESYFLTAAYGSRQRGGRGDPHRVLKNTASLQGRGKCYTFAFDTFEAAVLGELAEIDPREILNGDGGPDKALGLARREFDAVDAELAEAKAFMDEHGFSPTIGRRIVDLEACKGDLAARVAEAREKAEHPLSETWGEAQTLIGAIDNSPDPEEARLRLRAALRRMVDSVWLLVLPRGADRLCAVQIWFAGGKRHRDYLILHRPPKANGSARTEGGWWVRSFAGPGQAGDLDLRKPQHAARLEKWLQAVDLGAIGD